MINLPLFRELHDVVIIYPDEIIIERIPYREVFEDKRGNAYYLDRSKRKHVFVGGYANEIDQVKFVKSAQKYEFEPSKTFLVAFEAKIKRALHSFEEDEWQKWAVLIGVGIVAAIALYTLIKVLAIADALSKIGVMK